MSKEKLMEDYSLAVDFAKHVAKMNAFQRVFQIPRIVKILLNHIDD